MDKCAYILGGKQPRTMSVMSVYIQIWLCITHIAKQNSGSYPKILLTIIANTI